MRPGLQIPAAPPPMVLRSSRDLFKDRHRRLGVVPARASPIAGVRAKTATTGAVGGV